MLKVLFAEQTEYFRDFYLGAIMPTEFVVLPAKKIIGLSSLLFSTYKRYYIERY